MFIAATFIIAVALFGFQGEVALPSDINLFGGVALSGALVWVGRILKYTIFKNNEQARKFIPFILMGIGAASGGVSALANGMDAFGVLNYTVGGLVIALTSVGAYSTAKNARQGAKK